MRLHLRRIPRSFLLIGIGITLNCLGRSVPADAAETKAVISAQAELAAAAIRTPAGMSLTTVASEPSLTNPVAFCFDPQGRIFVVETDRLHRGVEDNRHHLDWIDDDLAARTVADRRAYTVKRMGDQIGLYTEADDRVRLLEDRDRDGLYEHATVYSSGYNDVEDGAASGALWVEDRLLLACIPSLYELRDDDGDGQAEHKRALASGFGVHYAFIGHDLHGLCRGPDGKIYFSIGDRGLQVETPSGALSNPNSGAVLRCNPDGSELEIVATGLRNPQELAFNELGDLFTVDNNSDSGDRARLVHIVEGMQAGWRMSYQYLGDRGPFNRERIWHTQNGEQPASIVPPLAHLSDGPSGLVHYPGTGLSREHDGAFFLCDFRGQAGGSGIREFWIEPNGPTYKLSKDKMYIEGVLATDCDFGPDGALYISDWVDGWSGTGLGRIHRVESHDPVLTAAMKATTELLGRIPELPEGELLPLLGHANQRVRADAQQQLVKIGPVVATSLTHLAADQSAALIPRLHSIWALGQLAMSDPQLFDSLTKLCGDNDAEVRAQAAKTLGRAGKVAGQKRTELAEVLVPLVADTSPRVRTFAAISLGNLGHRPALSALLTMAKENDDREPVLRHAAVMGLAGSQTPETLLEAAEEASDAERLALVVALGRQKSPLVAHLLDDDAERVRLEAARAIWDVPIPGAYGELAAAIDDAPSTDEPLLRRVLAANSELGGPAQLQAVIECALRPNLSTTMREHAWELVRNWAAPTPRDPVHGEWRPVAPRDREEVIAGVKAMYPEILKASSNDPTGLVVAAELGIKLAHPLLLDLVRNENQPEALQVRALAALDDAEDEIVVQSLDVGLKSDRPAVRSAAQQLLVKRFPSRAVEHLREVIGSATLVERQSAFDMLAKLDSAAAREIVGGWLDRVENGSCSPELALEVLEAARQMSDSSLKDRRDSYFERISDAEPAIKLAACLKGGDAERGRRIFEENTALSCRRCHATEPGPPLVGPNLGDIGVKRSREELLASVVNPNEKIAEGFHTVVLQLDTGKVVSGIVRLEDESRVVLVDADGKEIVADTESIDDRFEGKSAMPEDLLQHMSQRELRDLVEYLSQLRTPAESSVAAPPAKGHGGESNVGSSDN